LRDKKIKAKDTHTKKKFLNTVTADSGRITVKNGTFSSVTITEKKIGR